VCGGGRHVIMFFDFRGKICSCLAVFSVFIYVYARNIAALSVTVGVSALKAGV